MISIDPYIIDIYISERIEQLRREGSLDAVFPDERYGYICEAVFGVRSDQIAAVYIDDADKARLQFFQLADGRLIGCHPGAGAVNPISVSRTEH